MAAVVGAMGRGLVAGVQAIGSGVATAARGVGDGVVNTVGAVGNAVGAVGNAVGSAFTGKREAKRTGEHRRPERLVRSPDEKKEQELLDALPEEYYDETFDPVRQIFDSLPTPLPAAHLEGLMTHQDAVKAVVDKQLSTQVMKNYSAFVSGMQHVHDVKMELIHSGISCKKGRRKLETAKEDVSKTIFKILAKHRKKARLWAVHRILLDVRTIQEQDRKVVALLERGDFIPAVTIQRDAKNRIANLPANLTLYKGLQARWSANEKQIEGKVEYHLRALCRDFNIEAFQRVLDATITLGTVTRLGADLNKHFIDIIETGAQKVAISFVSSDTANPNPNLLKIKFFDLCGMTDIDKFRAFTTQMCDFECGLLYSAMQMRLELRRLATVDQYKDASSSLIAAASSLQDARAGLWSKCQQKLVSMLRTANLTTGNMSVEEFLEVLSSAQKLIAIGEHFSGEKATGLADACFTKSREYVRNFHTHGIDTVKSAFDIESWKVLPVAENFSINSIPSLRATADDGKLVTTDTSAELISKFQQGFNPFRATSSSDNSNDNKSDSKAPSSAAALAAAVAAAPAEELVDPPVLTNTSLTIAKFMGKYIAIMRDLRLLSSEGFKGLQELFDLYLYVVFTLFGVQPARFFADDFPMYPVLSGAVKSVKLRVERGEFGGGAFKEHVVAAVAGPGVLATSDKKKPVGTAERLLRGFPRFGRSDDAKADSKDGPSFPKLARLQTKIDLGSPHTLFGLVERCVACESMTFLVTVLEESRLRLRALLPHGEADKVDDFVLYAQTLVEEMRTYFYRNLAPYMLPFDAITKQFALAKWDIASLATKNNAYCDQIVSILKLSERTIFGMGSLPRHIFKNLWKETIVYLVEQLVDLCFSRIKKISAEGRGSIGVDLSFLRDQLERLTQLRPLPRWDYVHDYHFAGYLQTPDELLKWIDTHPDYQLVHCVALAHTGPGAAMPEKARKLFIDQVKVAHTRAQEKKEAEAEEAKAAASSASTTSSAAIPATPPRVPPSPSPPSSAVPSSGLTSSFSGGPAVPPSPSPSSSSSSSSST